MESTLPIDVIQLNSDAHIAIMFYTFVPDQVHNNVIYVYTRFNISKVRSKNMIICIEKGNRNVEFLYYHLCTIYTNTEIRLYTKSFRLITSCTRRLRNYFIFYYFIRYTIITIIFDYKWVVDRPGRKLCFFSMEYK